MAEPLHRSSPDSPIRSLQISALQISAAAHDGRLDHLIRKYSTSGPRYTSYPTAVEFSPSVGESVWREEIARDRASSSGREKWGIARNEESAAYSLYFHIPFCESLCYFCACNKIITREHEVVSPYLQALIAEIKLYRSLLAPEAIIEQIHWGGGSPNFLKPDEMQKLHTACLQSFSGLADDADVSVEIDPRTTSEAQLETLFQLGFNRVSLGVQDFDPAVQRLVNRIQPYELTAKIVQSARDVGFAGVNIDLIYGLPLQTVEGFSQTVDKVLELRPERVALYGYAHVTWIKKVQKALERAHLPTPAERIEIFLSAIRRFADAGYRHIGMDHFALPSDSLSRALDTGRLNRNFMGYSTHRGARLIGMGVSAISSLPSCYAQNVKDLVVYQERIASGSLATERGLIRTPEDQLRGEVIESILCQGRLDIPSFDARWGCRFMQKFAAALESLREFQADGLLEINEHSLVLTELGGIFARNIAMAFDEYLPRHRQSERPVFSQAV